MGAGLGNLFAGDGAEFFGFIREIGPSGADLLADLPNTFHRPIGGIRKRRRFSAERFHGFVHLSDGLPRAVHKLVGAQAEILRHIVDRIDRLFQRRDQRERLLAECVAQFPGALQRLLRCGIQAPGVTLERLADIVDTRDGVVGTLRYRIAVLFNRFGDIFHACRDFAETPNYRVGMAAHRIRRAAQPFGSGFRPGPHRFDLAFERVAGFLEFSQDGRGNRIEVGDLFLDRRMDRTGAFRKPRRDLVKLLGLAV